MNTNFKKNRFNAIKSLAKKYGYYGILGVALTTLVLVVVLTTPTTEDENVNVGAGAINFSMPVADANITKGFSDSELQYNQTLNQWEAHMAISFAAPYGTSVFACYDGVVDSIYTNYMEGTVIILDHGEGLKTVYKSLDTDVDVEEGDLVTKGDAIASASNSAMNEAEEGSNLRFEVWENDEKVDPSAYLDIENK